MTTIELAKKKWARKMERAGQKWKKGVTDKSSRYAKGVSLFIGKPVPETHEKVIGWREGVEAVTPEDFANAVRGKEAYWAEKYIEAFS
ncbi:MAG: hypothetical protein ABIK75_07095 [candidate division WOR-3 bacterium]